MRPVYKSRSGGWSAGLQRAIPGALELSRKCAPMLTVLGYSLCDRFVEWSGKDVKKNFTDDVVYDCIERNYEVWLCENKS